MTQDSEQTRETLFAQRPQNPVLDPVLAYDRIATAYARISDERRLYLDAVDRIVLQNIPRESCSLLDVGAGDGRRAFKIAREARIDDLVLLEPSREMQKLWNVEAKRWAVRVEELAEADRQFDLITCLWNVLGHLRTRDERTAALRKLASLLSAKGVLFLDVNHRYNIRSYGVLKTAVRFLHDSVRPGYKNGDVSVTWRLNGETCTTTGHVFTKPEIVAMANAAGLKLQRCVSVDYRTGELRSRLVEGHLLFIFTRD